MTPRRSSVRAGAEDFCIAEYGIAPAAVSLLAPTFEANVGGAVFETWLAAAAVRAGAYAEHTELVTASDDRRLALRAERSSVRADGQDLAFVVVELVDRNGTRATDGDVEVELTIEGPAALQGFGSAAAATEESYVDNRHRLYDGRALAVLRPTGRGLVTVSAGAAEFAPQSVTVEVS